MMTQKVECGFQRPHGLAFNAASAETHWRQQDKTENRFKSDRRRLIPRARPGIDEDRPKPARSGPQPQKRRHRRRRDPGCARGSVAEIRQHDDQGADMHRHKQTAKTGAKFGATVRERRVRLEPDNPGGRVGRKQP